MIRLQALASRDRHLATALVVSLGLHGLLLMIGFVAPPRISHDVLQSLDVTLLTGQSTEAPRDARALAQINRAGGGNRDDGRSRLTTPLPPEPARPAASPRAAPRHEAMPPPLPGPSAPVHAAADAASPAPAPVAVEPHVESPTPAPALSGRDLLANALLAARQDARADRELSRFESAPRRRFVGAQTREARFALYVDQWREKIERTGNHNYPADARGRVYGSLRLTVAIRADGSIESLEFDRRSGRPQLDQAAERIVRLAAPFAAFPPDLRRDTDVLVITRTWYFEPGDTLRGE